MNTSGFHQNVDEGNKSFNAMSPDPYLSEGFGKGSGCARLIRQRVHNPHPPGVQTEVKRGVDLTEFPFITSRWTT